MDFKLICDVCSKLQDSPPVVTEADFEQIIKTLKNNNASDGCGFHQGSTVVVFFFFFFCSSVPVVLFDTPGISRCRSQHVSVESSSLLHHSIYP